MQEALCTFRIMFLSCRTPANKVSADACQKLPAAEPDGVTAHVWVRHTQQAALAAPNRVPKQAAEARMCPSC